MIWSLRHDFDEITIHVVSNSSVFNNHVKLVLDYLCVKCRKTKGNEKYALRNRLGPKTTSEKMCFMM